MPQIQIVAVSVPHTTRRYGEQIEYDGTRRTGRRFVCPSVRRPNDPPSEEAYLKERHRDLHNNATQILAAIYAYQVLVLYSRRFATADGEIQWILDGL